MKVVTCFLSLLINAPLSIITAQEVKPVKYKDFVFEGVSVQRDLMYRTDIAPDCKKKYSQFDWYEPAGDSTASRPLIIWLHGGGFKFGKKTSAGTPVWSKTFARRGYVCAALNYRLSKKHPLKNFADLVQGCADAIEDLREAITFFKQHCRQFRIDSTRIILAGNSAGGMIALQAVYSSPWEMAQLIHKGDSTMPSGFRHNAQQVAAVVNCWGALFNTRWLENTAVPIVSIHGQKDRVVPYDHQNPSLYGSLAIHRVADSLHIANSIKIFEGYGHELQKHFNPLFSGSRAKKRWLQAGDFIAAFLYEQLFAKK